MDAIVVPVGGGGLIAGISLAIKTLNPDIEVIVRISIHTCFHFETILSFYTNYNIGRGT